jgi:hypothetical protein
MSVVVLDIVVQLRAVGDDAVVGSVWKGARVGVF